MMAEMKFYPDKRRHDQIYQYQIHQISETVYSRLHEENVIAIFTTLSVVI